MSIKSKLKNLLRGSKKHRIVFEWVVDPDGNVRSNLRFSKTLPVTWAVTNLDRMKAEISVKLAKKVQATKIIPGSPERRKFIAKQTLGDIL